MTDPDEVIRAAEEVTGVLESRGVGALVIGAVALAAHGYVRFTEDLDLGVNTDLGTLIQVADALQTAGFEAELREPGEIGDGSGFRLHSRLSCVDYGACQDVNACTRSARSATCSTAPSVERRSFGVHASADHDAHDAMAPCAWHARHGAALPRTIQVVSGRY